MNLKISTWLATSFGIATRHASAETVFQRARVTRHPEKPGVAIPADFLGFSCEKKMLSRDCFQPTNAVLIHLFRNLGPGVLRLGGAAVESTFWSRNGTSTMAPMTDKKLYEKGASVTVGPLSGNNLFAFAKQSGWRVIYGLNLGANKPDRAADEADYARPAGGPSLLAFEVGNEPNLFHTNARKMDKDAKELNLTNLRPSGYSYAQYRHEIATYGRAILAKSPRALLAGPATAKTGSGVPDFLRDFKSRIVLVPAVIRLSARSLTSTAGVTLASSAVADDGAWTPQPGEPALCLSGKCEVSLPAASAALLTIE